MSKILITGASGLIGKKLSRLLKEQGHEVFFLGRTKHASETKAYVWDVKKNYIEHGALDGKDIIIHLAGASVAGKRWTDEQKREILESRTLSTKLLADELKRRKHSVKAVIAASAIGYYGFDNVDHAFIETDSPGNDFLAEVVKNWEKEQDQLEEQKVRLVRIRIGIVLSREGGALKELMKPVKLFMGAPLGSGKQYMSWIHIDDLCNMFQMAVNDSSINGAYNAVAPVPVTNHEFTRAVAAAMKKPLLLPPVPGFVLRMMLGEMASLVLRGSKVSPEKIQRAGFQFKFDNIRDALSDLLSK